MDNETEAIRQDEAATRLMLHAAYVAKYSSDLVIKSPEMGPTLAHCLASSRVQDVAVHIVCPLDGQFSIWKITASPFSNLTIMSP